MKALLDTPRVDGSIEPIWAEIKADVETKLWDEFKQAFADNRGDARFLEILDNGHYLPAPDLSGFETLIQASSGYGAYLEAQSVVLHLAQHSLWANRHSSEAAQAHFDRHYGLILH